MLYRKSLKDFLKQACDKGSKCNKDIVNSKEIKKKLQKNYNY